MAGNPQKIMTRANCLNSLPYNLQFDNSLIATFFGNMLKIEFISKKVLHSIRSHAIIRKLLGRLAQLVEHSLDVRRVRDSSSLSSTTKETSFA